MGPRDGEEKAEVGRLCVLQRRGLELGRQTGLDSHPGLATSWL